MSIPQELSEAARIDGASELGILTRIILPLSKPALAVVGLFTFMGAWDNYLGPLIYINDQSLYPVALGLQLFQASFVEKLAWPLPDGRDDRHDHPGCRALLCSPRKRWWRASASPASKDRV